MIKSLVKAGNENIWIANKFYMPSNLKDDLRIEFIV